MAASIFPFACVFVLALLFLVLTIVRQSKFSLIYASFSMVLWLATAGLTLLTFDAEYFVLSWVFFGVAIFTEIVGFALAFGLMSPKTDRDMSL